MVLTPPATARTMKASSGRPCGSRDEVGSVQNDQAQRIICDGEGARYLDLVARPIAGRARCRWRRCRDPGRSLSWPRMRSPALRRQPRPLRPRIDAGVFGDRQGLAERPWNTQRTPSRAAEYGLCTLDDDCPAVRGSRAGKHMHERRLAGPVMADKSHALAAPDGEIDAVDARMAPNCTSTRCRSTTSQDRLPS